MISAACCVVTGKFFLRLVGDRKLSGLYLPRPLGVNDALPAWSEAIGPAYRAATTAGLRGTRDRRQPVSGHRPGMPMTNRSQESVRLEEVLGDHSGADLVNDHCLVHLDHGSLGQQRTHCVQGLSERRAFLFDQLRADDGSDILVTEDVLRVFQRDERVLNVGGIGLEDVCSVTLAFEQGLGEQPETEALELYIRQPVGLPKSDESGPQCAVFRGVTVDDLAAVS